MIGKYVIGSKDVIQMLYVIGLKDAIEMLYS